jgi:hypothetical protein
LGGRSAGCEEQRGEAEKRSLPVTTMCWGAVHGNGGREAVGELFLADALIGRGRRFVAASARGKRWFMGEPGVAAGTRTPRYQTTLDRTGLALGTGGALYGMLAMLLVILHGARGVITLIEVLLVAAVLAMGAITATFGPLWLALHASGRRGPGHAAALGAAVALALWAAAAEKVLRSYAFADAGSAALGWLRAIGVALIFAAIGVTVALAMWRVAYRRVR